MLMVGAAVLARKGFLQPSSVVEITTSVLALAHDADKQQSPTRHSGECLLAAGACLQAARGPRERRCCHGVLCPEA